MADNQTLETVIKTGCVWSKIVSKKIRQNPDLLKLESSYKYKGCIGCNGRNYSCHYFSEKK